MTNLQFAAFCKKALQYGTVYMWGCYGQRITAELIERKAKQYPARYSAKRQEFLSGLIDDEAIGCDCAGLIKWFLWTAGNPADKPVYSAKTDRNTGMLWSAARERGKIAKMPEIPGLVVYKTGHVGVYIGGGKVIECTLGSRGDGVVEKPLAAGGWTHWLKVPEIQYVTPATKVVPYRRNGVLGKLKSWLIK